MLMVVPSFVGELGEAEQSLSVWVERAPGEMGL